MRAEPVADQQNNNLQNQGNGENPADGRSWLSRHWRHWQSVTLILIAYDIVAVNAAYFLALWFRFDCTFSRIDRPYLTAWGQFVPFYTLFCVCIFWVLKLYKSIWRFASYTELLRIMLSSIVTGIFHAAAITLMIRRMPMSYYFLGFMFQFVLIVAVRFSYRFVLLLRGRRASSVKESRVMIIGAGNAGQMLLRDLKASKEIGDRAVCIIDDNPNKWNRTMDGVPIVGGRDTILHSVNKYDVQKIYLAIPSATAEQRRDILNICKETDCELKNLPGIYQFVLGEITVSKMKDVSVEDLLGREPITADMSGVFSFINGKTVLITGGGGSIGSELCRQIAMNEPRQLIIFDIYENNAYEVQNELKEKYPDLDLRVQIGSVRDKERIISLFETFRPQLIFHAAAHKHVPLMEDNAHDAVKNNIFGTLNVARAADQFRAEKMVLISTDKAVRPTNVMGATKRVCEMIIQSMAQHSDTVFASVRFGNVLGSSGSVIPIFRRQIAEGGPVTVTHPEIIRYFMTIPEAVSLVLRCGALARDGELFLLDMGEPVKILDLAENMIRLSGLKPYEDIQIVFTGLRPGEKLYEELLINEDNLVETGKKGIFAATIPAVDTEELKAQLEKMKLLLDDSGSDIRPLLKEIVPEYKIWEKPEDTETAPNAQSAEEPEEVQP